MNVMGLFAYSEHACRRVATVDHHEPGVAGSVKYFWHQDLSVKLSKEDDYRIQPLRRAPYL